MTESKDQRIKFESLSSFQTEKGKYIREFVKTICSSDPSDQQENQLPAEMVRYKTAILDLIDKIIFKAGLENKGNNKTLKQYIDLYNKYRKVVEDVFDIFGSSLKEEDKYKSLELYPKIVQWIGYEAATKYELDSLIKGADNDISNSFRDLKLLKDVLSESTEIVYDLIKPLWGHNHTIKDIMDTIFISTKDKSQMIMRPILAHHIEQNCGKIVWAILIKIDLSKENDHYRKADFNEKVIDKFTSSIIFENKDPIDESEFSLSLKAAAKGINPDSTSTRILVAVNDFEEIEGSSAFLAMFNAFRDLLETNTQENQKNNTIFIGTGSQEDGLEVAYDTIRAKVEAVIQTGYKGPIQLPPIPVNGDGKYREIIKEIREQLSTAIELPDDEYESRDLLLLHSKFQNILKDGIRSDNVQDLNTIIGMIRNKQYDEVTNKKIGLRPGEEWSPDDSFIRFVENDGIKHLVHFLEEKYICERNPDYNLDGYFVRIPSEFLPEPALLKFLLYTDEAQQSTSWDLVLLPAPEEYPFDDKDLILIKKACVLPIIIRNDGDTFVKKPYLNLVLTDMKNSCTDIQKKEERNEFKTWLSDQILTLISSGKKPNRTITEIFEKSVISQTELEKWERWCHKQARLPADWVFLCADAKIQNELNVKVLERHQFSSKSTKAEREDHEKNIKEKFSNCKK